jgi:hypothetical protein
MGSTQRLFITLHIFEKKKLKLNLMRNKLKTSRCGQNEKDFNLKDFKLNKHKQKRGLRVSNWIDSQDFFDK